ncbi:hypothetical protein [Vagococcus fluvialis]|uniref:hypothetical protein n=1 Tax=Vagococcus fluvialis TaxID=2738 RepID=UPI003B210FDF
MYSFGLLGYRDTSFLTLKVSEFLSMIDGAIHWELEQKDGLYAQQSIFVAHLMSASGNLKKDADLNKVRKQIYPTLEDRKNEQRTGNSKLQYVGEEKINQLRAELKEKFNITE